MAQLCTLQEAIGHIRPGMRVMIGGFLAVGTPESLIDALIAAHIDNLTVIANDTAFPDRGIGKLVVNRLVRKVIVCHIGTNPVSSKQMQAGELEVELIPQGNLIERIRAAGAGLGGVLSPTGVGTIVEERSPTMVINGRKYLVETPISADVGLIKAHRCDRNGNLVYHRTARNYNPTIATACKTVVVEVDELVDVGQLDPDAIVTPGIYVDYVYHCGPTGRLS